MSSARDDILAAVRDTTVTDPLDGPGRYDEANARMSQPRANLIPARAQIDPAAQRKLFADMAISVSATVQALRGVSEIPAATADFLAQHNLPSRVKLTPDPLLKTIAWQDQPSLSVATGVAEEADTASLAVAVAGVAETGTLVMLSGPEGPTTNNFLPENHLVVLPVDRVVGAYEEVWQQLRGDTADGLFMPRTVNWITGPSRSGDIEQQIQLGVHGPRRLHILMVEDGRD